MSYAVKEMFFTLQGEGARSGRPAVFLRFAGCNLWSGLERDRAGAACRFCDTDFVGMDGDNGGRYRDAQSLVETARALWPGGGRPYVVCTGGEPLLQLDRPLLESFRRAGFEIGIETNGTLPVPDGVDWICVSPKGKEALVQQEGDELKLVYPQPEPESHPSSFEGLNFGHFYLQPLDVPGDEAQCLANLKASIAYCLDHPHWSLSLQTHKQIGIR